MSAPLPPPKIRKVRGLYGMVDLPSPRTAIQLASLLLEGGAQVLQLRMKEAPASSLLSTARELVAIARAHQALLIVNDRLDVALAAGADGVHLGQDDLDLADARRLSPPGFLIGVSTHDRAQAERAAAAGADYLGFGPVFPTASKARPDPVVGVAALAEACRAVAPVPVVAIGGVTVNNAGFLAAAGAAAAAVIAAVNLAADPVAAARAISARWPPLQ